MSKPKGPNAGTSQRVAASVKGQKTKGADKAAKGDARRSGRRAAVPGSSPMSDSRARAREAEHHGEAAKTVPPRLERLQVIVSLMATGAWNPAKALDLAQQWGISPSTLRDTSAEASRALLGVLGPPEELRAMLLGYLHRAIELAALDESAASAARAMVAAVAEFARITGVSAPVKVAQTDATGSDLPPALRGIAGSPAVLAFIAAHDRLPTEREAAELTGA